METETNRKLLKVAARDRERWTFQLERLNLQSGIFSTASKPILPAAKKLDISKIEGIWGFHLFSEQFCNLSRKRSLAKELTPQCWFTLLPVSHLILPAYIDIHYILCSWLFTYLKQQFFLVIPLLWIVSLLGYLDAD